MPKVQTTVWHLEMTSRDQLKPKPSPGDHIQIIPVKPIVPELNRFFYSAIGGDWFWVDRLPWTYSDWLKYLDRDEVTTWMITSNGVPAGYFELEKQGDSVEIVYFGLLKHFIGNGLGGYALTQAALRGWEMGVSRVWVHTCNWDHPGALSNYLARGFRQFKVEVKEETLPDKTPGPWPNACA
jgi:hypothetical protein